MLPVFEVKKEISAKDEQSPRRDFAKASLRQSLILWLFVLIAVKAVFLLLDSMPALFMGDSDSYLTTAYANYIPPDRSFVYGLVLRIIAYQPHSLSIVILFQAGLSALSASIVSLILIRYFKTRVFVAAFCSFLCAVEPLQLLSERFILTEALSTFLFALFLLTAFHYLATSNILWLGLVQVIGAVLITLRISFLPEVLLGSFFLPLLTQQTRSFLKHHQSSFFRLRNWKLLARQVIVPVLFSLILSQFLLSGYRHLYGSLMTPRQPPAFLYADGLFLASSLAPVIQPGDYPIPQQRDAIFRNLKPSLEDRRTREAQRWTRTGLCTLIIRASGGDLFNANRLAKKTALRAVKRDPFGVLRLAASTFLDYFDRDYLNEALLTDEGSDQTVRAEKVKDFKRFFNEDFTKPYDPSSFTKRWHRKCQVWYWFLLLLPLLFLAHVLVYMRQSTPYHWLCAVLALFLLEGATVTVVRPVPRFLTAMAWLGCILVGAALTDIRRAGLRSPIMNETGKLDL